MLLLPAMGGELVDAVYTRMNKLTGATLEQGMRRQSNLSKL